MKSHRQVGAVLPLVVVMLPVIFILAAFAINIAYIQLCQTELQISTDVAAKAAGRNYAIHRDFDQALAIANQAGQLNQVAGAALSFEADDLKTGMATLATTGGRYEFSETSFDSDPVNSLELVGRRESDSANGEIGIYLPTFLGANQFEIRTTSVSTQVEVDVAIVLDRSGSMAYASNEAAVFPPYPAAAPLGWDFGSPAPTPCRWRDAVASVNSFLSQLSTTPLDEQVALATYADGARIDQDLTRSYGDIQTALNQHTRQLDGGGTNIAAGLQAAQAALSADGARSFASKVIIILTDGKRSVGPNPTSMAQSIADDGTMIIAITFAQEADQGTMQKIAEIGNGFHIHAVDSTALLNAFETVNRKLPTILTR